MRRTLLATLLAAVLAAVVFVPSAMAKTKGSLPSGPIALPAMSSIDLTNMTLASQDQVLIMVCVGTSEEPLNQCSNLGTNGSTPDGSIVQLADWSWDNQYLVPLQVRLFVMDYTAQTGYVSDGTLTIGGSPPDFEPGNHATLGLSKTRAILLSMNDGSQNTTTDWQPALGQGNFNATVQVTTPVSSSTGVTITNIKGYSDSATLNESNQPVCSYHAVVTYTTTKAKLVQNAVVDAALFANASVYNMVGETGLIAIDTSPFNPGTFFGATNPALSSYYVFGVEINNSSNSTVAMQFTSPFTLDPATYVDGCPPAGLLVSTDFGA